MPRSPVDRTRSSKIHPWVSTELLGKFEKTRIPLGLTRDGAVEIAFTQFITKPPRITKG